MSSIKTPIIYKDAGSGQVTLEMRVPHHNYLNSLMKKDSFPELLDLFRLAGDPAKELTESYSAYRALRQWFNIENVTVLHIGDGAHARTAAMFAFLSQSSNIAIDPQINFEVCSNWSEKFSVRRFDFFKCRWQEFNWTRISKYKPILLTFVHAHVNTKEILEHLRDYSWIAAYVSGCCQPEQQLDSVPEVDEVIDWGIISPERRTKLIRNIRLHTAGNQYAISSRSR